MSKRVAIIGAGVSGLPTIKHCLEEGLEPVCFEMRSDLGGLWNYVDTVVKGRSSVMERTVTVSSKETYCYSDFPAPDNFPVFIPHRKFMEYLRLYAGRFDLEKHIRYNTEVVEVVQANDFKSTGKWNVTTKKTYSDEKSTETFDGVFVCNGHHSNAFTPPIDGQKLFKGVQMHSNEFRTSTGFEEKRVVVVGIGVSGAEVASELSSVCSQIFLSTRRGAWIINRLAADGKPYDLQYNRQALKFFMSYLPSALRNYIWVTFLHARFNHEMFGLEPEHTFEAQNPLINDDLGPAILCGRVKPKGGIEKLTENSVIFEDGTREDNIDAIVYATGYNFGFPFVKHKALEVVNYQTSLYKFVFSPEIQPPTLAVIGCIEPFGGIVPVAEIHSRWAARIIKGAAKLPSAEVMRNEIKARNDAISKIFIPSMRHGIHYGWMQPLDEVAEEIGCKPDIKSLLKTDPRLALALFFGPALPFHYRLCGPGAWPPARQTILGVWDRIASPMQTRKIIRGNWRLIGYMVHLCIVLVILLFFLVFVF
jgi:dimethylaniline monooxygenase (N-oxide forming)